MPLRPDLPAGLNLSRRTTTPVKLPKMSFPRVGGVPSDASPEEAEPQHQAPPGAVEGTVPLPEEADPMEMDQGAPLPATSAKEQESRAPEVSRVIVYGRSGCEACMAAIRDLIERQVSFTYHDVSRDEEALAHLRTICGDRVVVPVIVQVGFGGT